MVSRQQITDQLLAAKTQAEKEGRHEFDEIVGTVFNLAQPLSITALSQLIGQSNDTIRNTLRPLEPLILVPDGPNSSLQIGQNPHYCRVSDAGVEPPIYDAKADTKVVAHCLRVMGGLHANMCRLESYGTSISSIRRKKIERSIPPGLAYACQFLTFHLWQIPDRAEWMDQLLRFLERHLLHLAEATILLSGWTPLVDMLEVLLRSFADNEECPLMQFLHAARHFMVQNSPVVYLYPLQLYASALVFEPDSSLIKRALVADIPCWLDLAPRTEETPGDPGQFVDESLIAGHTGPVLALAFSPDGRLAASGSSDHTAAMWNTQTGTVRHKLRDHATRICHVVFSPDGQLLASGAADHSVRLWDTRTGRLRHTLICTGRPRAPRDPYDGGMIRVVFSPDGRTLAVEICDERVWLWDVVTGFLRLTVDCHDGESRALAFSPDGRRVTSGSKDHSIQMWDVATGVLQKTLQGHEICIIDVAFSRDGRRLVSVGGDLTVRLWDTETGALQRTLRDFVNQPQPRAVGFSPDGRLVALGGEDGCLYIWDAGSGKLLQKVPLGPVENTLLIGGASGCSSYIETDVGCVDIRRWLPGDASPYPEVYRQDLWIMYQGRREMRLPDRYRRPQASAYRDGILALGYDSGRVIFLGFGKE